jgi:hypothetical protein
MVTNEPSIAIRRAREGDRAALERLAALDSRRVPPGEVLIADVGGEQVAATGIVSGLTIAHPFRPTAHAIGLLDLRAAQLRQARAARRGLRLRARAASRLRAVSLAPTDR